MQQLPLGVRWHDNSVFASFLVGPNALLVETLSDLGRGPGPTAIWIWGPPASGKSHLLQAACAATGERGGRAAYFPLRDQSQFGPAALGGCELLDLVCIDDADVAASDPAWERALFVLHNGLQEQQGHLLLAAEGPPAASGWSLPDLASRLAAALVLQIRPLSESEQAEALRLRAGVRGLELPEETASYLLKRFPRDLRTLCALLDTLDTASLAAQRRLTVPFIKQVVEARETVRTRG